MTDTAKSWIEERRDIHAAASAGPWESGYWHRHWLLSSGRYIKTSDPDMRKGYGWAVVGESGPELVKMPHHHGAALWMPSEPGSRHWPGCGCP